MREDLLKLKNILAKMMRRYVRKQERIKLTTESQEAKMEKCMNKFSDGNLHDRGGGIITDREQAIAICLREAKG